MPPAYSGPLTVAPGTRREAEQLGSRVQRVHRYLPGEAGREGPCITLLCLRELRRYGSVCHTSDPKPWWQPAASPTRQLRTGELDENGHMATCCVLLWMAHGRSRIPRYALFRWYVVQLRGRAGTTGVGKLFGAGLAVGVALAQ